jgi:tetratricopeptide (TPR) repeat protein
MKSEEHHSRQSVSETAEEHFLRGVYYYDKGLDARNAQDADSKKFFIQAFECFTQAAEMGNLHAQNQLGICYEFGLGIGQDCEKAIGWYTRAAEKGCSKAQNNLGCCYGSGEGVKADMREAFEWCRKAAKQGNPKAQYNLGVCYDEGIGIQRDAEQAVFWFKKRRSTDLSGPRKRRGSSSSWAVACKKTRIRPLNGSSRLPSRAMPRRRKIWAIATAGASAQNRITARRSIGTASPPRRDISMRRSSWETGSFTVRACYRTTSRHFSGI